MIFWKNYKLLHARAGLSLHAIIACGLAVTAWAQNTPGPEEALGSLLFFDKNLSLNRSQACATCHNPAHGLADNRDNGVQAMASLGDDGKSLGNRNAPTASYTKFSPVFHYDKKTAQFKGGQFWDGREPDLAGQAGGPPLNPIEMAMPNKSGVIGRIKENPEYVRLFKKIYGSDIFADSNKAYMAMTRAIAAFEKTDEFSPFDSKYDRYLQGKYEMTALEELGMSLFFSEKNTNCAKCHVLKGDGKAGETFSNYEYHNIGVPPNQKLRAQNKPVSVDKGLLANPKVKDKRYLGKFKVPTLRNIAVTAPYMHNGVFAKLSTVIEFYDMYNNPQRKLNPETGKPWRAPEVRQTISQEDLKAKKLTRRKIDALVAFLTLLTDKKYEHLLKN